MPALRRSACRQLKIKYKATSTTTGTPNIQPDKYFFMANPSSSSGAREARDVWSMSMG